MQKIFVKTFGCSANIAEGEIIKGQFSEQISENEKDADTIILNICTVKGDKKTTDAIKKIKKKYPDKKIVITGCIIPEIVKSIKKIKPDAIFVDTHNILKIKEHISEKTDAIKYSRTLKILQPRIRENPAIGIVPISTGCLDMCAYCSTRLIKGALFSFPPEDIEKEVKKCVSDGCREIWITGQDTCCYGFDRKTNLAELLNRLVQIPGNFRIRVGMGNPRHLSKYIDKFIKVMKHDKLFKFLHLPLQAGNDNVLKAMNRGHNVQEFRELITKIKKEIPDITLSTDLIVGYPGETEEQFNDTLEIVKEIQFDVVNISRYAERPGTASAKLKGQVHGNIRKARSRKLTQLQKEIAKKKNEKWIGWEGDAIIDTKVKGGVSGRNYAYKSIFIPEDLKMGSIVKVKATKAHARFLTGRQIL